MQNKIEKNKELTEIEIEKVLETVVFKHTFVPAFKFPEAISPVKSPYTWYKSYIQIAAPLLFLPAFIFAFSFLFNSSSLNNSKAGDKNLAMLEASNQKLLKDIQSLEDENLNK